MSICLYVFSMHQIFKLKLPTLSLLKKQSILSCQTIWKELFEIVKTYQVHANLRIFWKYSKNEYRFSYNWYFTKKTIVVRPLDSKLSNDEKEEFLALKNTLKQVRSYIDNHLNTAKVNVIDPTKDNFTQPLSVQEVLDE